MHAGCHAIVLAAGASARFDGAKLLADVRNEPLVRWPVYAALGSRAERVTVVLGARSDAVAQALAPLRGDRLSLVENPRWRDGLSSSLRVGLCTLPQDCRVAVIFLGDMPRLSADLANATMARVLAGAPAALPCHAGMPGHPVALSRALFARVEALAGDRGARAVLKGVPGIAELPSDDPGCVQDIDTRQDLHALI